MSRDPKTVWIERWYNRSGLYKRMTDRVEINGDVMHGKPVIRGTRVPVEVLLRKLAEGATTEELLDPIPGWWQTTFRQPRPMRPL